MHYLAIVTSLVSFFRSLGGILALTLMSSVVNNKVSSAFSQFPTSSGSSSSSLNSLNSIQSLPPAILAQLQNAFADAIRWGYIALIPFVCIAAISAFFLREVKIERSVEEERRKQEEKEKTDAELGHVPVQSDGSRPRRPRVKIYGPLGAIIWVCQAIGDKMGWRK